MGPARIAVLEWQDEGGSVRSLTTLLSSDLQRNLRILHTSLDKRTKFWDVVVALKESTPDLVVIVVSSEDVVALAFSLVPFLKKQIVNLPVLAAVEVEQSEALYQLLEAGVDDFVASNVRPSEILPRIQRLLANRNVPTPEKNAKEKLGLSQLIGNSSVFVNEVSKIPLLARCDACVLISGETGTGKELCARAIHYLSHRSHAPFIPINCGALPLDLVENELFGHERGAFTGASTAYHGLIHEAQGGTMLLDEIDCLPPSAQVKLLRFLQEKEYRPLGSSSVRFADVRLLAALNVDLQQAVETGRVRRDLYYRLNVISFTLPPLRDRREDIPLLARHFLEKYALEFDKELTDFSEEAMAQLLFHSWPGNVRELEHIVERAALLSQSCVVDAKDILCSTTPSTRQDSFRNAKAKTISAFEKSYIEALLLVHQGNISSAARAAQKNRRAFWELIRKHQINTQNFKP